MLAHDPRNHLTPLQGRLDLIRRRALRDMNEALLEAMRRGLTQQGRLYTALRKLVRRDGLSLRAVARLEGVPLAEIRHRIDMAREFVRAKLADEYQDSLLPPPTESIFEVLDRIEPTPEQLERMRAQLHGAAA